MPNGPVSAHDVSAYIIKLLAPLAAMRLHKLLYYSQAWSLVWDKRPLFTEEIEAWANGPVIRAIYELHSGRYMLDSWDAGNSAKLAPVQRETVDAVVEFYGDKSAQFLSDLTHQERPWSEARTSLRGDERGSEVITHASMAEYYGSL